MFNIHYIDEPRAYFGHGYDKATHDGKVGTIVSYQEGPKPHKGDEIPYGCKCLTFESMPQGFFMSKENHVVMMKVVKGKLVFLREPPQPIQVETVEGKGI